MSLLSCCGSVPVFVSISGESQVSASFARLLIFEQGMGLADVVQSPGAVVQQND